MSSSMMILAMFMVVGCSEDCHQTITGVNLYGAGQFGVHAVEKQFMNRTIILIADLEMDQEAKQFPNGCNDPLIKNNTVIDTTMKLYCNKDLYLSNDTLFAGKTNLLDRFEVFKNDVGRARFISVRNKQFFNNQSGFYTFYFSCMLSNTISISDSCLLKIDF